MAHVLQLALKLKQPSRKCKQAALQLQDVLGVPQLLQHVLFRRITDLEAVPNWGCATREPCGHYVASTDFLLRASFPPLLAQGLSGLEADGVGHRGHRRVSLSLLYMGLRLFFLGEGGTA